MVTTQEAAKRLQVSRSRVLELIKNGQLCAKKISGIWFVDEASVEARMRTVNRKGGRPKRGSGKNEARFAFMNRTHQIADVVYDTGRREFSYIGMPLDTSRMPIGLRNSSGGISLSDFNSWWRGRGIPNTRNGLEHLLQDAGVWVPEELIYRNLGLSLSDQYWINPYESEIRWERVNFFNNAFEKVDASTKKFVDIKGGLHAHPDNTSDGILSKEWTVRDGVRMLRKGGLRNNQEPYNEVVATSLHKRLLKKDEYVSYWLESNKSTSSCLCSNFLTDQEEYVPATYVMQSLEQSDTTNDFDHYLNCCEVLGVANARGSLERMMVCDDIMANTDRHFRNFGIVRNVETLECRPAPIFDTGTSLWCEVDFEALEQGEFSFQGKQFESSPARQMLLIEDFSWFDTVKLEGFVDEAMEILAKNRQIENRLPYICNALERRLARMIDIAEWS